MKDWWKDREVLPESPIFETAFRQFQYDKTNQWALLRKRWSYNQCDWLTGGHNLFLTAHCGSAQSVLAMHTTNQPTMVHIWSVRLESPLTSCDLGQYFEQRYAETILWLRTFKDAKPELKPIVWEKGAGPQLTDRQASASLQALSLGLISMWPRTPV